MNQDMFDDKSSTVCLDSAAIKRTREGMQLTQLYVSKVVGVTTDTISRWENNRYPTIRRENALKLAQALEVPLSDILLKPVEAVLPVEAESRKPPRLILTAALLFVLATLAGLFLLVGKAPSPIVAITAERFLPKFAAPGSTIPVQIVLIHRAENSGVIVREYFPKGWKIIQTNPPASSLDNVDGIARWIIKAGDDSARIVYLVQVDPLAVGGTESAFRGELVASRQGSQSAVPVQGEEKIVVAPVHWADADGNGHIDDVEMLEASFTIEDMAGVHMDWNDLEKLWAAGRYLWSNEKGRFLPQAKAP